MTDAATEIGFGRIVPVLRMFDVAKAREFYVDWLGFTVDWEHRFEDDLPLYMQVSRGGIVLQLSEHHGDGSPGASFTVETTGVEALHRELTGKRYRYGRPGIAVTAWNTRELQVWDPFGNRIRFSEAIAE